MNLPNKLTVARLIMVPVFVVCMSRDHYVTYGLAFVVFIVASITDYYDGKIARERNLITNFGKLMDPLADKVLLTAAFVMLLRIPSLNVPAWTIVAILARAKFTKRVVSVDDMQVVDSNRIVEILHCLLVIFRIADRVTGGKYVTGVHADTDPFFVINFIHHVG